MNNTIVKTNFKFPEQTGFYKGKIRDVYEINNEILVMIATDRISAFDTVLPKGIPYKGQVLNQIASSFLDLTSPTILLLASSNSNTAGTSPNGVSSSGIVFYPKKNFSSLSYLPF